MQEAIPPTVAAFDDLPRNQLAAIEVLTQTIGRQIFANLDHGKPHIWQRKWWDDRLLAWSMHDEQLKVQLFRFVDVLPMLRSSDAVMRHLHEYLDLVRDKLPESLNVSLGVARRLPFTRAAVARAARIGATDFAKKFIAGENVPQVVGAARRERGLHRAFTLDILGEAVIAEAEAEQHFRAYLELLESIAPQVKTWPADSQIDADDRGPIPRLNLSIKLSALDSRFDAIDPDGTARRVGSRLRELFRTAQRLQAFINVDMESYDKKALTLEIFKAILSEPQFRDWPNIGIVLQCYLTDTERDLLALRDWAQSRGTPVWVRLVKGAYWDYETIRARSNGWPVPVFQQKWQSDANFERCTRFLLQNTAHLRPALGSHNIRSLAHGIATAQILELPQSALELQMLYGMADAEKDALVRRGQRLRVYMPYGELIPGMAYLVRRLLENTSNDSFLRAGFIENISPDKLLQNPASGAGILPAIPSRQAGSLPHEPMDAFKNQPPVDFAIPENREAMRMALASVRSQFGRHFPLVIGGNDIQTPQRGESTNPADKNQIVGTFAMAEEEHVHHAVVAAKAALPDWHSLGAAGRGRYLRKVAAVMRARLFELAAIEVYECGKEWREATADVDEAIDFCEFYAAEAFQMQGQQGVDAPGEENRFDHLPRGVVGVIAPWNFPLAILTGMSVAALATGNTVVMKPAEQSSVIAAQLMDIFREVELPAGVLNYLPGRGEVVGAGLVEHPDVALIAFTGSRAVGLSINAKAAEVSKGKCVVNVKRVIAEMGGKNAIIIDSDADLDEAVSGVVKSAFGYQGQKCSACSRAIVVGDVYEPFLKRLVEATKSLKIGPAEDPSTSVGPVIDGESFQRIKQYIEIGKTEGRIALGSDIGSLAEKGWYIGPHIFADISPNARIAQEEIFGPVLAVIRAADLNEALKIANGTDYALTGGIYSRSPAALDRARREFMVGNLYLNRSITGALVNRQPFGGFKMSGIGSKAGSRDYLLQFVIPRTITEHTIRRGFAPPPAEGE
ncbi:MAG TPA: L-glutamate gamma-semialdehyde dehydrogenase [Pirellulaceae bacterium]|jgi:RHH-type proline utilization regulon transcriptional repressor/proline dehydrogenase/delta 1-pyrroline-5-carboxylate dehydrogenase